MQETAIRATVEQAELRRSVRDLFLSLARRSQTLVHRQLTMLDAMERRATDAAELDELFRVDHLATRMRRNAENLIVLAGAVPGRGWRRTIPVVDVIRAAVAEVEEYPRVNVLSSEAAGLAGHAVGDVVHLLAELMENALAFSPRHTLVNVGGSAVGAGYVIEVEDHGLGMTPPTWNRPMPSCTNPPSSCSPARRGSACTSSAGSPSATTSRSGCSPRRAAAPRRSCCCRRAWSRTPGRPRPATTAASTASSPARRRSRPPNSWPAPPATGTTAPPSPRLRSLRARCRSARPARLPSGRSARRWRPRPPWASPRRACRRSPSPGRPRLTSGSRPPSRWPRARPRRPRPARPPFPRPPSPRPPRPPPPPPPPSPGSTAPPRTPG
ncbi:hypothetical protein ACFQZ4_39340 [Catellatospora coxensis]